MIRTEKYRFWILVSIVAISGFSQGMLLPIIAVIFEKDGMASSLNGLNATALYLGVLIASPLMEAPLRKMGYKPLILIGGFTVALTLFLFPLWKSFWFWFALRLLIGIGDHTLHFATQTWITSTSSKEKLGRNISLYGLFFSLGFAFGPSLTSLVKINEALPFMLTSAVSFILWITVFTLRNDFPEKDKDSVSFLGTFKRFGKVWKYAWVALLPPFGYGFMEASLNGSFPVFSLRNGINVESVSFIIPAFSIGSIITQLPLGMLSDKFGRKNTLIVVLIIGLLSFISAGLVYQSVIGLVICFLIAGMAVGSTFSLGISYMADLLPKTLFPAGNIMCGILFSLGSMVGPFFAGMIIEKIEGASFFYLISTMLFIIFLSLCSFRTSKKNNYSSISH
ncbi:MFS transporter [Heyndrickxia oleronia]|jgi:MFS family permease|uniref:MFS transporter n=1 Tax=Heyndrickxia oleronia TaxID=38875 RepID=UPI002431F08C|nr:MFS transporter [Heyndrickxia oleronia]MCI1593317.1 MFS transporter [Heyndrickxia oleronia]MCI1613815.1 MFS transporter [Heyndrickxia oleronia]MCI1744945.1 MFS transporter [Heyndrickxia oleronia]MCI1761839.1 MFS transporter [Heyndrickxia oleronia]